MKGTLLINRFSEKKKKKNLIWASGPFWAQKWHIITTESAVRIFVKFCTMKGVNR